MYVSCLSPAGKGLTSWLSCMWCFFCVFVTLSCGVLGQVWYLIVSIADHYLLTYFAALHVERKLQVCIRMVYSDQKMTYSTCMR